MIGFTNITPIGENVLIEIMPNQERSDGGLILLDSPMRASNRGIVRALGPRAKLDVEPGFRVIFDPNVPAMDVEMDKLRMLPAESVLAIIEPC